MSGNAPGSDRLGSEVHLWSLSDPTVVQTLGQHETGYARSVAFAPDGSAFAVFGTGRITVWDPRSKRKIADFPGYGGHDDRIGTPSHDRFTTMDDRGMVRLHDWRSLGDRLVLPPDAAPASTFAFAPDGRTIAVGSRDGMIRLREASSFKEVGGWNAHPRGGPRLAFSPDGTRLASGSEDHEVIEWDLATRASRARHEFAGSVSQLVFDPRGTKLSAFAHSGSSHRFAAWGPGSIDAKLDPDSEVLAISPDGTRVVLAKTQFIHDAQPGTKPRLHFNRVTLLLHDLTTSRGRELYSTRTPPKQPGNDFEERRFLCASFAPDGKRLAASLFGHEGKSRVLTFDVESGRALREVTTGASADNAYAMAFAPNGRSLATLDFEESGMVWNAPNVAGAVSLARVRNYDLDTGECLWRRHILHRGPSRIRAALPVGILAPDGRILAVRDSDQLDLLDAETGEYRVGVLEGTRRWREWRSPTMVCSAWSRRENILRSRQRSTPELLAAGSRPPARLRRDVVRGLRARGGA